MKENKYFLNTALALVLGAALLVAVLVRTFAPIIIIPALDIPNMVLLSLAALLLDHYVAKNARRCYLCIPVLGALTFGLLPFAACFVGGLEALKLGITGGIVFTAVTWCFSAMMERISTGPVAKAAPFVSAFGLYLAIQALMGMF